MSADDDQPLPDGSDECGPPLPLSLTQRERQPPPPPASTILSDKPALMLPIAAVDDAAVPAPGLAQRREAAQAGLGALRASRADELLRGAPIDAINAAIGEAEATLAALDDAAQLAHDRQRQAEAAALARRLGELRKALRAQAAARLAAVEAAQQAFEAGAAALRRAADRLADIRRLAIRLGAPLPLPFHSNEAALRLSRRVAAVLATPTHRNAFGAISWGSIPYLDGSDWSKAEAAATRAALDELTSTRKDQP